MTTSILATNPENFIFAQGDDLKTTSLKIAEAFGKLHKHVLRDIERIISQTAEILDAPKFGLVDYLDAKGESRKMYEMNQDGLVLVVMGYTGIDAMKIKVSYINAFNFMRQKLFPKRNALVELPASPYVTANEKLQLQKMINARVKRTNESHSMAWHILFDAYRVNKMEFLPTGRLNEMCAYMGERTPHQDEMVLIKKRELDELKSATSQEMRLPKGSIVIDETYLKTLHHNVVERDAFQIKSLIEKHGGLLLWQEQIDVLKSVLKLD